MNSSYTIDDLHAIERAIASAELTVSYKDRTVTYRSIEELRMAKDDILKSIQPASQRRSPFQKVWFDNP
jgi:hypothetical protein